MTSHLTDDQVSRWVIGSATTTEQIHVRACGVCSAAVSSFEKMLTSYGKSVRHRSQRQFAQQPVFDSGTALFGTVAGKASDNAQTSGMLSLLVHAAVVGFLLIPAAIRPPKATVTSVMLLDANHLVLNVPKPDPMHGGGGGGMKALTPPSKGIPPRGADKQLAPPMVEAKNLNPDLIVEPTIVAPQLSNLPQFNFNTIGDPNGVAGPPSPGPGTGGGVGNGNGRGVGDGKGPGLGPGEGGGTGGGVFNVGGGVSEPRIRFQPQPEYSEDGRKARAQGTVEMLIVVREDGSVDFRELTRRLGYGLDQKAIEAVQKWRFDPGKKDGMPVAVFVNVLVTFTLR